MSITNAYRALKMTFNAKSKSQIRYLTYTAVRNASWQHRVSPHDDVDRLSSAPLGFEFRQLIDITGRGHTHRPPISRWVRLCVGIRHASMFALSHLVFRFFLFCLLLRSSTKSLVNEFFTGKLRKKHTETSTKSHWPPPGQALDH